MHELMREGGWIELIVGNALMSFRHGRAAMKFAGIDLTDGGGVTTNADSMRGDRQQRAIDLGD